MPSRYRRFNNIACFYTLPLSSYLSYHNHLSRSSLLGHDNSARHSKFPSDPNRHPLQGVYVYREQLNLACASSPYHLYIADCKSILHPRKKRSRTSRRPQNPFNARKALFQLCCHTGERSNRNTCIERRGRRQPSEALEHSHKVVVDAQRIEYCGIGRRGCA